MQISDHIRIYKYRYICISVALYVVVYIVYRDDVLTCGRRHKARSHAGSITDILKKPHIEKTGADLVSEYLKGCGGLETVRGGSISDLLDPFQNLGVEKQSPYNVCACMISLSL